MGTLTTDVAGGLAARRQARGHDVARRGVGRATRRHDARRVGHAGTLDPFATGSARRPRSDRANSPPSVHRRRAEGLRRDDPFGEETDTDDATGAVTRDAPTRRRCARSAQAIARLTGDDRPDCRRRTRPRRSAERAPMRRRAAARRSISRLRASSCIGGSCSRATTTTLTRASRAAAARTFARSRATWDALDRKRRPPRRASPLAQRRRSTSPTRRPLDAVRDRRRLDSARCATRFRHFRRSALTDAELARVSARQSGDRRIGEASLSRLALIDESGELVAIAERSGGELRPKVVLP